MNSIRLYRHPTGNILCLLMLVCFGGCQQNTVNTLLGRWEGQPDTASDRAQREEEKFGSSPSSEDTNQQTSDSQIVTDWEKYDANVRFNFQSSSRVEIALDGNENIFTGTWRIVVSTPTGCTIEVVPDQPDQQSNEEDSNTGEPRRFELELDFREGECVGFLLSEVGADRQLGALYFRRPTSTQ